MSDQTTLEATVMAWFNRKGLRGKYSLLEKDHMMQMENELIDKCAAIAEKYALEERAESKRFGQLAKKDEDNSQYRIAQATHAIISVVCSRIAEDIRKLKHDV